MKDFRQSDELKSLLRLSGADDFETSTVIAPYTSGAAVTIDGAAGTAIPSQAPTRQPSQPSFYERFGKRTFDAAMVLLTLPVTLPVILLLAAVLLVRGGKPFYLQKRLGLDGKVFNIIKLRSMVIDADARLEEYLASDPKMRAEWDTKQKLENDPRITKFGRFLRATSLDELPQLINVLIGDMSLVGPRPMMVDQLDKYGNPKSYFAVRPGITGVWQVSGRNETSFAYRNVLDRKYKTTMSMATDLALLFKTVDVVLKRTGK